MADSFQEQINQLDENVWWLDNVVHVGPGCELEGDLHGWEPEGFPGNAREPQIGHMDVDNSPILTKPLIMHSLYNGKTSCND